MPQPTVNQNDSILNASGEDENIYETNGLFPETLVTGVSTGAIWEWQLATIPVALFQYNPVAKNLFRINGNEAIITFEHNFLPSH